MTHPTDPTAPGVDIPGAAKVIGITEEEVGLLMDAGVLVPINEKSPPDTTAPSVKETPSTEDGPAPNVPGCECLWRDPEAKLDEEAPLVLCPMHERMLRPLRWDTLAMMVVDLMAAVHEYREARALGRAERDAAAIDAAHLTRQRKWSARTFGPGARTAGVIDHIRKELREIEADPADVGEWVDVVILAFDGAWRAGYEPQAIIDAIVAKQAKNEARTWPDWRDQPPDKAIEHDRAHDRATDAALRAVGHFPVGRAERDAEPASSGREAALREAFRVALRPLVRRQTPTGPCFCGGDTVEWHEGWVHAPVCLALTALLAADPDASTRPAGQETAGSR